MRKVVGTIHISKEKIRKASKKMTAAELEEYYKKVRKSGHVHKSKKDYNRKNKEWEKLTNICQ